jgi:hypothetical protein
MLHAPPVVALFGFRGRRLRGCRCVLLYPGVDATLLVIGRGIARDEEVL